MERLMLSRFVTYLEAIARLGSVRRAADHLNVSASAIDKQLLRAEEELGVPLFERMPRGMRLTSAGELLIHRVRGWQRDMGTILTEIEELRGLRRGEVRIAAAHDCMVGFLPQALQRFHDMHPRIACKIEAVHSDMVRQMVIDGRADFGLTFSPPPMPGVEVASTGVFAPFAMMCPQEARDSTTIEEFFSAPTILADSALYVRDIIDILSARLRRQMRPGFTTNSLELTQSLVARGLGRGIVILPEHYVPDAPQGACYVRFSDKNLPLIRLSLIVPADRSISVAALTARDCFARCLRDPPAA